MRRRKAEHVHVERAESAPVRPRAIGEHITGDDGTEAIEERRREGLLDRRERDPVVAMTQETVTVEKLARRRGVRLGDSPPATGLSVRHPSRRDATQSSRQSVDRGTRHRRHNEQPRAAALAQLGDPMSVDGPTQNVDAHAERRTTRLFRSCYSDDDA